MPSLIAEGVTTKRYKEGPDNLTLTAQEIAPERQLVSKLELVAVPNRSVGGLFGTRSGGGGEVGRPTAERGLAAKPLRRQQQCAPIDGDRAHPQG